MQAFIILIVAFLAWAPLSAQTKFCGTTNPSKRALDAIYIAASLQEALQPADGASEGYVDSLWTSRPSVSAFFHVLYDLSEYEITESHFIAQFRILRDYYATIGIDMDLKQILYYNYPSWSTGHADQMAMMEKLRIGTYYTLNIFFLERIWDGDDDDDTLGLTQLPEPNVKWASDSLGHDGVLLSINTLPGYSLASEEEYNEGKSLLHEVGHWFGLLHIFHKGCDPDFVYGGDMVKDTPPQQSASEECFNEGTMIQLCPEGFPLSYPNNLMDYQADICTYGLTYEQIRRMHLSWTAHRAGMPKWDENMPADPYAPRGNPTRIVAPEVPALTPFSFAPELYPPHQRQARTVA